jgi:hypothetical protein
MLRRPFVGRSVAALAEAVSVRSCHSIRPHFPRRHKRAFHTSIKVLAVKPFLLADIGEGALLEWPQCPEVAACAWTDGFMQVFENARSYNGSWSQKHA